MRTIEHCVDRLRLVVDPLCRIVSVSEGGSILNPYTLCPETVRGSELADAGTSETNSTASWSDADGSEAV